MSKFTKPQRLYSQRTIDEIRSESDICEYCQARRAQEVHHIRSKGSGGPDIRCNLIALCVEHHRLAQGYKISPLDLFQITARREGLTLVQVYEAVGLPLPDGVEEEAPPSPVGEMDQEENSWEADVSTFIQLQETEDQSSWKKAEHAAYMLTKYGRHAASKLASDVGVSASYIRSLAQMAKVFPESERDPALSLSHHRIAAMTEAPGAWLDKAAELELSVRELTRAIQEQRDQVDQEEQYRASVERVEQAIRKFNEAWETRRNIKAVLTWEDAGFRVVKEVG